MPRTPRPPLLQPFDENITDDALWEKLCARITIRRWHEVLHGKGALGHDAASTAWLEYRERVRLAVLAAAAASTGWAYASTEPELVGEVPPRVEFTLEFTLETEAMEYLSVGPIIV